MLKLTDWILPVGFFMALAGGAVAALCGPLGILITLGVLMGILVTAVGLRLPSLAPYLVVAAAVFDRQIRLSETVSLTTLTVVLLLLMPGFVSVALKSRASPRFAVIGVTLLNLGFIFATIAAPRPDLAWLGPVRWIPVLVMVLGVAAMCATEKGRVQKIGWAILIGGAVSGVFGVLQRNGVYTIVGAPYAADVTDSTFGYYTNFANFEALASVVGVGLIIASIRSKRRLPLIATGLTLVCMFMVVTSFSRGAVILLVAGLAVILARELAKPGRFIAACMGLALLGWIVLQLAPAQYVDEIFAKFTNVQGGDAVRDQLQDAGFTLLTENPLGIGFNNFSTIVASGEVYASVALAHSHSTFIQMGLDAGWLGALGFVVLVIGATYRGFRSEGGTMAVAFSAALVGFLVQVSQDYFFFEEASLAMFGLLIAGAVGVLRRNPADDDHSVIVSDRAAGDRLIAEVR